MTVDELKWLVVTISNAPVQSLDETELKARLLGEFAQQLRRAVQEASSQQNAPP